MCSCAFYPLHLVYSGLIWTFGVRVNYISKLFLHFYIHILAFHRVLSWFSEKFRRSELNLERKFVFTVLTSPNWRSSNTDTSRHHIFQHSGHVHGYSVILENHLCMSQRKKCPGTISADVHRGFIKLSNMWTFLFSLFHYTYILAIIVIQSRHTDSGKTLYSSYPLPRVY